MATLNPDVLRWARETADLAVDEAAKRVGLRDSGKGTAAERLRAIERGAEEPTLAVVREMAHAYRRPLLALYLAEPPRPADRGEDFRSLPTDYREEEEALVDALLRDIRVRRQLLRVAMEDEEEAEPLEWVGRHRRDDGVATLVGSLEAVLGMTREDFRSTAGHDSAFQRLRSAAEAAGAFVLLVGDLGSHHTQIDVDVFRGFALADPVAPFIVVNDQDARSAWSFTLLHEFVHLLLGVTGISAGSPSATLERFCNEVASAFLVAGAELGELVAHSGWAAAEPSAVLGEFSPRLVQVTSRMLRAGALTTTRAGQVLGVSPRNVGPLLAESAGG